MDPASHSADHTKEKRITKVRGGGKSNLKRADRTVSLPKWMKEILISYDIHESTMELPLPSDRNGCDRLANWLNALHNYIDVTNPFNLRKRSALQKRLYQFREVLRGQFGFTAQSFARRKRMARHEVIPSELAPPFSQSQIKHLADGDKNALPSSPANQHVSPPVAAFHDILDQSGDRPTDAASHAARIPHGAPTQPDHNRLGNSINGPEATSATRPQSKQPIMPSSSTFNDMIAANQDPHLIEMLKDVDEYTALHPSQDELVTSPDSPNQSTPGSGPVGALMHNSSNLPAPIGQCQYHPNIPVDPELTNEEHDWRTYFNFGQ
ncbi:hypothetical protein H0H93_012954 [Arthromyces matolae]|nr:hypothetical protein H0H93_012954 [Arthromyces matolae]